MQNQSNTPYLLMQTKNEAQEEQYVEDNTLQNLNAAQAGSSRPGEPPAQETKLFLGPKNSLAKCPHCRAQVRTTIKHTTTTRTHMIAALCCSFCCMCCIPYCMESTRNADHYCPNCANYIGSYEK